MQDEVTENPPVEEPPQETPPAPASEPESPPPEEPAAQMNPAYCEPVPEDGTCGNCGWEWGKHGRPHEVAIMGDVAPVVEATPPPPAEFIPPPPDPNACPPVAFQATCPKCGWSGLNPETAANPHPVI